MIKKIETHGADGLRNGFVLTLWNSHEDDWQPEQVYVTVIEPGCSKGPHLHKVRHGRFVCIAGNVRVRLRREDGRYEQHVSGDDHQHAMIEVPPGVAAELINDSYRNAIVINMPNPAWRADDQDEHPVENWSYGK